MESDLNSMENIKLLAEEKIATGKKLIETLNDYKTIPGAQKIQRKINQEIKFLDKVKSTNSIKLNHVMCSNLTHYEFLVRVLQKQKDVVHMDCPFLRVSSFEECGFATEERPNPLRVDIVCENGMKWIKVIARNSRSITDAMQGRASYGAKSIVDQAEEFVNATSQNLCMFTRPKVLFCFSHEIEPELLEELKATGVETVRLASDEDNTQDSQEDDCSDISNINTLNLDITTMLGYVSNLTNGSCYWKFKEPILTEQAEKESESPLKPILDNLFQSKRLVCCESAIQSFQDIVSLLAGAKERKRAEALTDRLEILPDIQEIPQELSALNLGGKIKPRSLKIFAFGMAMKALTVTSNEGFVRSARMQGINVPVFLHQARALTEAKEESAESTATSTTT